MEYTSRLSIDQFPNPGALRLTAGASSRARDLRWVVSLLGPARDRPQASPDAVLREALLASNLSTVDFCSVCRATLAFHRGSSPFTILERALKFSQSLDVEARAILQRVEVAVRTEPVTGLDDLAESCRLRSREMSRAIKAVAGVPYGHLRIAQKVRPAIEPLLRTSEQVAQIAYQVGYRYPTQFDRDFRLVFGVTPTSFRARLR